MNQRFYIILTRIVLMLSAILAIIGSVTFFLLGEIIHSMPFSDF